MTTDNPFMRTLAVGIVAGSVSADERISDVRRFNRDQCQAALAVPGLQKTVERAIRSRLSKLEKQGGAQ